MAIKYRRACEGQKVHVFGYAFQMGNDRYIDAGELVLSNGTSQAVAGAYQPLATRTIQLANLPPGTISAVAAPLARSATDLIPLSPIDTTAAVQGQSAVATIAAAPGSDTLLVEADTGLVPGPAALTVASSLHVAAAGDATTVFDASVMLPMFDSIALDSPHPLALTWKGGGTGGTLIATEVTDAISGVTWRAYLPPSTTSASLPALPADLGVPTAVTTFSGSVIRYDVPGATAADIIRTLDRAGYQPYDDPLLWSEGVSTTQIASSYGVL